MKKQLAAALCLFTLAFGASQLPARADFTVTYGKYNHNHDGRWNYSDFRNANSYYFHQHPHMHALSQRELRRDFDRMDADHDGFVKAEEVQSYRTWE